MVKSVPIVASAIIIVVGLLFIAGGLIAFFVIPQTLKNTIAGLAITDSAESSNFNNWQKTERDDPADERPVGYYCYFWNITNFATVRDTPNAVPQYEEVGPYVWFRYLERFEVTFTDDGNYVTYKEWAEYRWSSSKSKAGANPKTDQIWTLNFGFLGAIGTAGYATGNQIPGETAFRLNTIAAGMKSFQAAFTSKSTIDALVILNTGAVFGSFYADLKRTTTQYLLGANLSATNDDSDSLICKVWGDIDDAANMTGAEAALDFGLPYFRFLKPEAYPLPYFSLAQCQALWSPNGLFDPNLGPTLLKFAANANNATVSGPFQLALITKWMGLGLNQTQAGLLFGYLIAGQGTRPFGGVGNTLVELSVKTNILGSPFADRANLGLGFWGYPTTAVSLWTLSQGTPSELPYRYPEITQWIGYVQGAICTTSFEARVNCWEPSLPLTVTSGIFVPAYPVTLNRTQVVAFNFNTVNTSKLFTDLTDVSVLGTFVGAYWKDISVGAFQSGVFSNSVGYWQSRGVTLTSQQVVHLFHWLFNYVGANADLVFKLKTNSNFYGVWTRLSPFDFMFGRQDQFLVAVFNQTDSRTFVPGIWSDTKPPKDATDTFSTPFFSEAAIKARLVADKVSTGKDNHEDARRQVTYKGSSELMQYNPAKPVKGNSLTWVGAYRLLNNKEDDNLVLWVDNVVREMKLIYQTTYSLKGIELYRYTPNTAYESVLKSPQNDWNNPKDFLLNLRRLSASAADRDGNTFFDFCFSLPHFFLIPTADTTILNRISGLSPDASKHEVWWDIEPISGIAMNARAPLQGSVYVPFYNKSLNILSTINHFSEYTRNIREDTYYPIWWISRENAITDSDADDFKGSVYRALQAQVGITAALIAVGGILVIVGIVLVILKVAGGGSGGGADIGMH